MKLSILLVSFNHETYIQQCLKGITIQQCNFEFEIIVADDCSTDNTLGLIREELDKKGLVYSVLESTKNLGLEMNYKRGFEACRGEYIAVLEGDDYWTDPFRLQKHADFLDQHHECSMSFNRLIVFDQNTRDFSYKDWHARDDYSYFTSRELAMGNQLGNLSACVFRKDVFKKLKPGIFNMKIADWMLAMAFGQFGLIGYLKEPASVYRIHSNGLWSNQNRAKQIDFLLEKIDSYNEYLNYDYSDEFLDLKKRLIREKNRINKKFNYSIKLKDLTPPLLITLVKSILPERIYNKLQKMLYS